MAELKETDEIKEVIGNLLKSATAKTKSGKFDEAVELLEQVLELDDKNTKALDLLGFVWWSLGDYKASEEVNRRSLEIRPLNAYALKGLGIVLAEQGKIDEGISELHHSMALKPLWVDPVHDLSMMLLRHERWEQAIPILERCLEMDESLKSKLEPMLANAKKKAEEAKAAKEE